MSKLPVSNAQGERVGECELADDLLTFEKGQQAVHDAVVAQQAARRAGSASTLTKGEVAGSGSKPYKQKGTGRARAGYIRSPIRRGGGVTFGPKPRHYGKALPKKMARLAFRRAVSEQIAAGGVVVLEDFELAEPKTRLLAERVGKLAANGRLLLVVDETTENLRRASRNLADVTVRRGVDVSTLDVLRAGLVAVTRPGLAAIETRLRAAAAGKGA